MSDIKFVRAIALSAFDSAKAKSLELGLTEKETMFGLLYAAGICTASMIEKFPTLNKETMVRWYEQVIESNK